MMDVSDGLLIDAARMAQASGVAITIDHIPLSRALEKARGASTVVQVAAARAGDDYELLFALPQGTRPPVRAIPVGQVTAGSGLTLRIDGAVMPLPDRLGWEHG
jgi:thiamine-monophosphate kinase